jgi:peptidyl-prolyl cis-trans isomerase SurA
MIRYTTILILWLPTIGPAGSALAQELLEGIAAQVGNEIVLISEVNQMAAPVEKRMRKAGVPESEIEKMRADVLDRLIETRLISEVVRRNELSASDQEVDRAVEGIAHDTGLSVQELEASVASHGLTIEEYRAKIRDEIERSKAINSAVRQRVRVEPEEVKALYAERFGSQPQGGEEVHLRHLLVAFGTAHQRDRFTACAAVEEAAARISSGEASFEEMAREISDANRERGGDLGWIHVEALAGWMERVVRPLEPGQLGEIVETRFGCNLLQLVERRDFEPVSFEQARPALENRIFRKKMEEEYSAWVDTLREQTYIERKGFFREAAVSGAEPGS